MRIHGAGPVGLMLALYLRRCGWGADEIELIDPSIDAEKPPHISDPRVLALSHGTLLRLAQLGIAHQATEIKRIHVSAEGHFGMMEIQNERVGVTQLGALLGYANLLSAMRAKAAHEGLEIRRQARDPREPEVVVIAEGGIYQSSDAKSSDPKSFGSKPSDTESSHSKSPEDEENSLEIRDYEQTAVIGWVQTQSPAGDTAYERFTADGAVALLPLGKRYALIWCCGHERAKEFQAAAMSDQAEKLMHVMRGRMDQITSVEVTGLYPLGMKWRNKITAGHRVWIGNSAQTLHPIAGQGMNLGFRDAETLSTCLSQAGKSIPDRLTDYARRRSVDRWAVRAATDTLARQGWVRRAIGGVALIPGAKRLLGQVLMYGG